jgi:hypothetical protein
MPGLLRAQRRTGKARLLRLPHAVLCGRVLDLEKIGLRVAHLVTVAFLFALWIGVLGD